MSSFGTDPYASGRTSGWKILQVGGIPVYVEPSFLFFLLIIILFNASGEAFNAAQVGLLCFVIFVSILIHELGHALTARLVGCDGIRVALIMFGGYATHTPTTRGRSLGISLAGPAAGLLLGGAALLFYWFGGDLLYVGPEGATLYLVQSLIFINFFWTFFNLLPIHPMDGGRALFHGLTYFKSEQTSMLWVARLSMVLCVICGILAFQAGFTFMAFFFVMFFMNNWNVMRAAS